jgi:hypothetical protein
MDQERFDRITRTLSSGQSRRSLLKGVTGTAIGGLLTSVGLAEASAKGPCKTPNTKCGKGKNAVCCPEGSVCTPTGCVTVARVVVLTWNPTFSSIHCTPTVSVSGFAPGTYTGTVGGFGGEVIVVVGADGTGSWTTSSLYTINPGTYVATVDGVASSGTIMYCPDVT